MDSLSRATPTEIVYYLQGLYTNKSLNISAMIMPEGERTGLFTVRLRYYTPACLNVEDELHTVVNKSKCLLKSLPSFVESVIVSETATTSSHDNSVFYTVIPVTYSDLVIKFFPSPRDVSPVFKNVDPHLEAAF